MVSTQSILLGFVGVLLVASVGGANAVVAGQRTVLDDGFVTDQFEAEEVYAEAESEIQRQFRAQLGENLADELPVSVDVAAVADEAISRSDIRNQTDLNVRRFYRYLHGNADTLTLSVDLAPVKRSIADAAGDEAATADVAELVRDWLASNGVQIPADAALVEQLTSGPDGYDEARAEFRDRVRERVVTRIADQAFAEATNDELLALVIEDYDPNDHTESEKEAMVADREDAIRTTLREQIADERSDDVDQQVGEALDGYRESLDGQQPAANGNATRNLNGAISELSRVIVTGFAGEASYDPFAGELETAKERLGTAARDHIAERLDEAFPTAMDLTEDMDPGMVEQFETARSAVSILDLLALVLPLLSLGLIGLAYLPSRSVSTTAVVTGIAFLIAGVIGFTVAAVASEFLANAIRESVPDDAGIPIAEIALGAVNDVFGTLSMQSLGIGLVGAAALVLVLAHRQGHLDQLLERARGEPVTSDDDGAGGAPDADEVEDDR